MMMRFLSYFFIIIGLTTLSAHAAETIKSPHNHVGYVKPGAAVSLHHDYDGQTNKGEWDIITVTIEHIYQRGYLSAQLLDTPNLQVSSDKGIFQSQLSAGSTLVMNIQFSSILEGSHTLPIEVIYEDLAGSQSRRVLSVPVMIGENRAEKSSPLKSNKTVSKSSSGIISLTARETIK